MHANDIRRAFLDYFGDRGHTVVPSSSLVPQNDPTLFFANAGMVQFKDVFTGQEKRDYTRAATVQKCLRVSGKHNDLENVGRTPRHHTFFEMLGNFSFGDYFKSEAIPMAWELLTRVYKVDPERLWVTIFETDEEAYDIWRQTGVRAERIQRLGAKENFWSMGDTGPCGPCSEIHYDHGPSISSEEGGPATDNPRYVEIWNNVFMQYEQFADGQRTRLPRPSIDTGMGLERIAAVLQGVYSNYDTDLFRPILTAAAHEAGVRYGADPESDTALRVIADHSRAVAFLVADGVMPSNGERGYVLRRIMRRAIRFGVKLGITRPFMHRTVERVIEDFSATYPGLRERQNFVHEVVLGEEERFRRTLDRGMKLLEGELERVGAGGTVPGDVAFTLSDTYGFPLDLTELIAAERNVGVDGPGFQRALGDQKARGRAAWKGSGETAVSELWQRIAQEQGTTRFTGYDRDADVGTVVALVKQTESGAEQVEALAAGESGVAVLDRTPFYAESGGQVGDTGTLGGFAVKNTTPASGVWLHQGTAEAELRVGDVVATQVDAARRNHTRRNHTATHLLHKALREVLGDHVAQKGSLVGPDRLRFDFSHHKPVTREELLEVEAMVNGEVLRNTGVETAVRDIDDAIADGAMALFGEKYGAKVRVVTVPSYSVELCGGTHVRATGDIGVFKIVSEGGIAAGVRRIEAQTGVGALGWIQHELDLLHRSAERLKTSPENVPDAIARLQEDRKAVDRTVAELKTKIARDAAGDLASQARVIGGVNVLAAEFDGDLREQADRLREQLGSCLVVLGSRQGDKVQLVAAASKDLIGGKLHAGKVIEVIAPFVGGRGGGRPEMAQAGGKDGAGLPAALAKVYDWVAEALGA